MLLVASTVVLASSDVATKMLAGAVPAVQIIWFRFAVYAALVGAAAALRPPSTLRPRRPGVQVLRGALVLGSAGFFVTGLRHLPVGDATAISFVNPIIVTLLSAVMLGETLGWRKLAAAATGFVGVLLVIGPPTAGFQLGAVFPLLSACCWALAVVLTRMTSGSEPALVTMAWTSGLGVLVTSALVPFHWVALDGGQLALALYIGVATSAGHALIVVAYRHAAASLLVVFSYAQIVWACLFGAVLLQSFPGPLALGGIALIVASGLFLARRRNPRSAAL